MEISETVEVVKNYFLSHHIDSYDRFIDVVLPLYIKSLFEKISNKVFIMSKIKIELDVELVGDISFKVPRTPHECRSNNKTYNLDIYCDIKIIAKDSSGKTQTKTFENHRLFSIPLMLQSRHCVLYGMSKKELFDNGECSEDMGCYFLVKSNVGETIRELCLIPQVVSKYNYSQINIDNDGFYYLLLRTTQRGIDAFPKKFRLHIDNNNSTWVEVTGLHSAIPVGLLFKLLGITNDKDIYTLLGDIAEYTELVLPIFKDVIHILSYDNAVTWTNSLLIMRDHSTNYSVLRKNITKWIDRDVFPQIADNHYEKAKLLANYLMQLFRVKMGVLPETDRENYITKRITTSGEMISERLRDSLNDYYRHIRNTYYLAKYKNVDLSIFIENLFSTPTKIFDPSIVTESIYKSFSGSDWTQAAKRREILQSRGRLSVSLQVSAGTTATKDDKITTIGDESGIVQEINRLSYLSYIYSITRIYFQMKETVKLTRPRTCHVSTYGFLCPTSVDGQNVGLSNTIAVGATITAYLNSDILTDYLLEHENIDDNENNFSVFHNGIQIGFTDNPCKLVGNIREMRRYEIGRASCRERVCMFV